MKISQLAVKTNGILLALALGGTCGSAAAQNQADCGGSIEQAYCGNAKITLLYIDSYNHAYVTINGNTASLPCKAYAGLLKLPQDATNFKFVYATLLAAHMSGRLVNIRLAPNAAECMITYVTMPGT